MVKMFEHVEEAEWAIEAMKATGKPVVICMTISSLGDMNKVPPGECAVRMARAGKLTQVDQWLCARPSVPWET